MEGFLRIHQIVGCRKRNIKPLIPVSRATWWNGVKSGRYPKGVKHGGARMWSEADIRATLAEIGAKG